MQTTQDDLFQAPTFSDLTVVSKWKRDQPLFVIGCSISKQSTPTTAGELYKSTRFRLAKQLAESISDEFLVLSAKHGLIRPTTTVQPYDTQLSSLSENELACWRKQLVHQLPTTKRNVCILASEEYTTLFLSAFHSHSAKFSTPLARVDERHHEGWLQQANAYLRRTNDLERLYSAFAQLRHNNATFSLRALSDTQIPKRGVYLFLDPTEPSFPKKEARIVRVGTHGVSQGSKSVLRTRLRNHLGVASGLGNHRGSIFRLHVGAALLAKTEKTLPSWGQGQYASKDTRSLEECHERRVSSYLSALEVLTIAVDDEPSKCSLRAHVERQLIGLLSENYQLIDRPSKRWLGAFSPVRSIVKSGLWNVRDVGCPYRPGEQGDVDHVLVLLRQVYS